MANEAIKRSLVLVGAACLALAGTVLADEGLRGHISTSQGMAPLIPMNSEFFSKAPAQDQKPMRGDVVVFVEPTKKKTLVVKRVVAVEGDEVEILAKELRVNDVSPVEPYVRHSDPETVPLDPTIPVPASLRDNLPPTRVPPGKVFVLGDNRDQSVDSRVYGSIAIESVVGYVVIQK